MAYIIIIPDNKLLCFNITENASSNLGMDSWNYQACTELILPISSNGQDDMFLPVQTWNFTQVANDCYQRYKKYANKTWFEDYTGAPTFKNGSNIIFSNGEFRSMDGWWCIKIIIKFYDCYYNRKCCTSFRFKIFT